MRTRAASVAIAASLALAVSACGSSDNSTTPGTSDDAAAGPLKIGVLASLTGPSSATFKVTPKAVKARIGQYVSSGGKCADRFKSYDLIEADDTNTPQGALQGAQRLVQQEKVDVILQGTASFYGAATFLTTTGAKTPVLGGGFDGSPTYKDPTNNIFGILAPIDYANTYTTAGKLVEQAGGTKVAVIAYDNPSSAPAAEQSVRSAEAMGLKVVYKNIKIPYGTTDVGAVTQGIIDSGADALITTLNPETSFAVTGGLAQAGKTMKVISQPIGYSADLLASGPAVQAAQGITFSTSSAPMELHTEATEMRAEALKTIGNSSGIAGFAEDQGYMAADMLIFGLEKAGCDASVADITKALRSSTDWNAGGLLAQARNFSSGEPDTKQCSYYVKLTGKEFVPVTKEAICGDLVK